MEPDSQVMTETLEDFGAEMAQAKGYDPKRPEVQARITGIAETLRARMPGVPDSELIPILRKQGIDVVTKINEQFKKLPEFDPQKYALIQKDFNRDYGGEAEVKKRQEVRNANLGNEIGRTLSTASRLAAGREYQGALDDAYNSASKANEESILGDWQTRRKGKIAEMEQMVRNGEVNRAQVKAEMEDFALAQLRRENASIEAAAAAAADPNSLVSQGARSIIEKGMPEIAAKFGDKWAGMTRAQIVLMLPSAEARIKAQEAEGLKKIDAAEKEKDRIARAEEARIRAKGVVDAAALKARAKASGGSGGSPAAKPADLIRVQVEGSKLDKQQRDIEDKKLGATESIVLFDQLGELVNQGLMTGPIVGGDNIIGRTAAVFSDKRQRANQIGAQLVSAMAKTFGAAPSDAESKLIREANTVLQQDDPVPALNALREKFQRQIELRDRETADINARKASLNSIVTGAPARTPSVPMSAETFDTQWAKLKSGQSLVGPDGKTYTKR